MKKIRAIAKNNNDSKNTQEEGKSTRSVYYIPYFLVDIQKQWKH